MPARVHHVCRSQFVNWSERCSENAAKVLAESKEPMACKEMIEAMAAKKLWTSPGGKTPHATLYTVVTMLPKSWQPGIDCSPKTSCDRSMAWLEHRAHVENSKRLRTNNRLFIEFDSRGASIASKSSATNPPKLPNAPNFPK